MDGQKNENTYSLLETVFVTELFIFLIFGPAVILQNDLSLLAEKWVRFEEKLTIFLKECRATINVHSSYLRLVA